MTDRHLVLTCMKNEGAWLLEWVAWHLSIGFDHVLAYTNDCEDGTDRMFERLQVLGLATHRDNRRKPHQRPSYQLRAYRRARREPMLSDFAYTAILDADEFLNIHAGDGSVQALLEAAGWPDAVSLPWRLFGNSGLTAFRRGLVTETLTRCAPQDCPRPAQAWGMKTLFRTDAFEVFGLHRPTQPRGGDWDALRWVDAAGRNMPDRFRTLDRGNWRFARDCISYELGQVNHYAVKYAQTFVMKSLRGSAHGGIERDERYWTLMNQNEDVDFTIGRRLPLARQVLERLLADAELASLHDAACEWHEARIAEAARLPDAASLLAKIGGGA